MEVRVAEAGIGFWKFVFLCLKEAIRTTWDKADTGATAVGIIIGAVAHFVPAWEHAMSNIAWEIPVACLASVGATRLLLSPFLIYRRRDSEAIHAEQVIEDLKKPTVRIGAVFAKVIPWGPERTLHCFEVENISEGATAEHVRVTLTQIDPHVSAMKWLPALPVPLHQQHDDVEPYKDTFSLNPGERKYLDLVEAENKDSSILLWITKRNWEIRLPMGEYKFTVAVTGKNIQPDSADFRVWQDSNGVLQCARV